MNINDKLYAAVYAWYSKLYDLHLNEVPQNVVLTNAKVDANGNVTDVTVPNDAMKAKKIDDFIGTATDSMAFLNLLKNVHMTKKDSSGTYIELPHAFYGMDMTSYRVIDSSTTDVPQVVKDYISGGTLRGRGNVLEINLTTKQSANFWLSQNSISGTFTGGWKWAYVHQGRLRDINAGEVGSFMDVKIQQNWNADLGIGDFDANTIVYMAHPFLVAGQPRSVDDIKTLNYTSINTKYVNLY